MTSLMVQGTASGVGKTTIVTALCRIFADKGYSVAPFKSQNMSNFAYDASGFEISRAQAIQAIGARCSITPDLNPILLKPLGDYVSMVYLNGKRHGRMHAREYYGKFVHRHGIKAAIASLNRLKRDHDLIILEGAGSPAEINLQRHDIANMRMAAVAKAPVILVSDIDRGGAFASLVGTVTLIQKKHRDLVQGFVFNRFRGDLEVLKPGYRKLRAITGIPVLGAVPLIETGIPEEDSLNAKPKRIAWTRRNLRRIDEQIDSLAKAVKESIDIKSIERMIK